VVLITQLHSNDYLYMYNSIFTQSTLNLRVINHVFCFIQAALKYCKNVYSCGPKSEWFDQNGHYRSNLIS